MNKAGCKRRPDAKATFPDSARDAVTQGCMFEQRAKVHGGFA